MRLFILLGCRDISKGRKPVHCMNDLTLPYNPRIIGFFFVFSQMDFRYFSVPFFNGTELLS